MYCVPATPECTVRFTAGEQRTRAPPRQRAEDIDARDIKEDAKAHEVSVRRETRTGEGVRVKYLA